MLKKVTFLGWGLYSLCGLLSAFLLSWFMLAQVNFAYPLLYDVMDIGDHVKTYGPQNQFIQGFENTNKEEHKRLFGQITTSIHNNGIGLTQLTFNTAKQEPIAPLLREPEIIHLIDVANLINNISLLGLGCFLFWLIITIISLYKRIKLPSVRNQGVSMAIITASIAIVITVIGATDVFYKLHTWLFPDNHQWFFYYQESLMTVLMKAPDLFGWVAGLLVLLGLFVFLLINWALKIAIDRVPSKSK